MMLPRPLLAVLLAIGVGATLHCGTPPAGAVRVVLITLDTLRLDSLLAGDGRPTQMPRLERWAERGRVFERYFSATSSTQPSHATLFTGLHPWEHGVPRNGMVLSEEQVTLAERLQEAGYETAAVVASFPLHSQFGWAQGFDSYNDRFTQAGVGSWNRQTVPGARFRSAAGDVTRAALEIIDGSRAPRQFLWLHYFDAHAPYGGSTGSDAALTVPRVLTRIFEGANAERLLSRARRLYDRDVRYLDESLDRVLERLAADAGQTETHIVLVSDHGESFGEGGSVGHGKRLTPEQIRVPCVVISPRVSPGVSQEPVGTTDLATTLLSLAGVDQEAPSGRDLAGAEEVPSPIVGMRRTFRTPFHERRIDGSVFVHDAPRFYVLKGQDLLTGGADGALTLNDTSEEVTDPETIAEARALFGSFNESLASQVLQEREDEETLDKLRALGYVR